ncbi:MAG: SAM-dependent methyltransferase [Prevotella sp.]|nr:SAM-dependent methyltransferase [Prevotella sp.]
MMNEATREFVRQHADDDVSMLALRGSKDSDVNLTLALRQIRGRQQARRKLPSWAALDAIVYPPHLNMEQCSSEPTARYKADLCRRLLADAPSPTSLLDLTGGFGVDFAFMQQAFDEATYVERDAQLCAVASQNFTTLGLRRVSCVAADAADYLARTDDRRRSLIYLDPARRDDHGARTYGIADCTPDVLQLMPQLTARADRLMLKLSPMLDWRKAVSDLGPVRVAEVHIVSLQNECKELLVVLSPNIDETAVFCINDGQIFQLTVAEASLSATVAKAPAVGPGSYLCEPNASLMKCGCFGAIARRYALTQLGRDSHLFVSPAPVADFPGRQFVVDAVSTMNRRELRQALDGLTRANIATRNFPLTVAELRRRLKLADGGDVYLFATTLADAAHVLIRCHKAPF